MLGKLRATFNTAVKRSAYKPTWTAVFLNPFYIDRRSIYMHVQELASKMTGQSLLDVGCGTKPYRAFFDVKEYIGLEIETTLNREAKDVDVFYNGEIFPFEDRRFDRVLSFQVFEHVFNPDHFLAEIARVLADDGLLLLSAPFVWDEHEQPFDYARYSSFGIRHIFQKHGLEVIEHRKAGKEIETIFQLINCYIYKHTAHLSPKIRLLSWLIFCFPITILGRILSRILPQGGDLYLENIVLARRVPRGERAGDQL